MSAALYWLTLTALMTALFWLPYSLNRILSRGLFTAMGNPKPGEENPYITGLAPWAQRAYFAHVNATENLAVFASLVLVAQVVGAGNNPVIAMSAAVYFFARLLHYLVYAAGIPVIRTLLFAVSWAATIIIGLALVGVL